MIEHQMLIIPLKTTHRFDVAGAIASWMDSTKFFSSVQCRDGLIRISSLRNCLTDSLCTASAHANAIAEFAMRDLVEYHGALLECESLGVPVEEGKMPFQLKWESAFEGAGTTPTNSSLRYERACILFNIAALESYLASIETLTTKEGLKQAIHRYDTAAGILSHIRQETLPADVTPSLDLTSTCLEFCEKILLAQGQACIYSMAYLNPTPNHSILAKIAMGAADMYSDALKLSGHPSIQNVQILQSNWTNHLQTQKLISNALAEYHEGIAIGQVAKGEGTGYGVEVARLTKAVELCEQAKRFGEKCEVGTEGAEALRRFVLQRKETKERDNREVYREKVPATRYIETIPGRRMAKPLALNKELSASADRKPLFAGIVPNPRHRWG